ncbi:hypothetical protein STANM309S_06285 [Streptomyces tanashiensis]
MVGTMALLHGFTRTSLGRGGTGVVPAATVVLPADDDVLRRTRRRAGLGAGRGGRRRSRVRRRGAAATVALTAAGVPFTVRS